MPNTNQLAVEFCISTPVSSFPSVTKNVMEVDAEPQRLPEERFTELVPKEVMAYRVLPVTE